MSKILQSINYNHSQEEFLEYVVALFFYESLFLPLVNSIDMQKKSLYNSNSHSEINKAFKTGSLRYQDGVIKGKFSANISKELNKLTSEQRKTAEQEGKKSVESFEKPKTVVVNKNQKGKPEENKALKVDNNKTETKEQPKTEDKTVSKEDLERILINVMTMNKNVNNGNFIIQNNIDETNPRSYTNVKSK
jgi:hypothetical protein